jgi:hypothetical protein
MPERAVVADLGRHAGAGEVAQEGKLVMIA